MNILKLPGLIDPHVHLRTPGQEQKEDFYTGTCAAVAGGFTTVLDMPNNTIPITTQKRLDEKISLAQKQIVCNIGFYFGTLGDNLIEFKKVAPSVFGLKVYLNETTGNFLIDKTQLKKIFTAWHQANPHKPVLLHAEDDAVAFCIQLSKQIGQKIHFCHISTQSDLEQIKQAKGQGLSVTCGVTPHHLFLTATDGRKLGPFGKMKPYLKSQKDVDYLWNNLSYIDCVESDHAPHTTEEKLGKALIEGRVTRVGDLQPAPAMNVRTWVGGDERQDPPAPIPFGVPGLETTLPLLLTAVSQKRLTLEDVIRLCHNGPQECFKVPKQENTYIEIDMDTTYELKKENLYTKCKWTPFEGWKVQGKITKVVINSATVYSNGKIRVQPGSGILLTPQS